MNYMFLSNNPSLGDINSSNLPCLNYFDNFGLRDANHHLFRVNLKTQKTNLGCGTLSLFRCGRDPLKGHFPLENCQDACTLISPLFSPKQEVVKVMKKLAYCCLPSHTKL